MGNFKSLVKGFLIFAIILVAFWGIITIFDVATNNGGICLFIVIALSLGLILAYLPVEKKVRPENKLSYNIGFFCCAAVFFVLFPSFMDSEIFDRFYDKFYPVDSSFFRGIQYILYYFFFLASTVIILITKVVIWVIKKMKKDKSIVE